MLRNREAFGGVIDNESQKESLPIKRYCTKSNVICDNRGRQYLDNLDVSIHTPEIFVSKKGLVGYLFNIFTISRSIREVTKILKDQNISVVLTTGAYIAPVAAIVSKILKAKFFIQEQNIYAGLGNKISAIFAKTIFTS